MVHRVRSLDTGSSARAEADHQAASASATVGSPVFDAKMATARAHEAAVLGGIRHLCRNDRGVLRWAQQVERGTGLADLQKDATDLRSFWEQNAARVAKLTRGEAGRLAQMEALAAELTALASGKARPTRDARRVRDVAYTIVSDGVRRIRAAAAYRFSEEPDRLARYAPFRRTAPAKKPAR